MPEFLLALFAFLILHVAPNVAGLRARIIARTGRPFYLLGYSLISVVALFWLIWSAQRAPYVELWQAPPALRDLTLTVMAFAFALLGAAAVSRNPLSISFRAAAAPEPPGGVLAITRHPVLWFFLLWAGMHMVVNGDLVAVILFGAFAVFSLQGMLVLDRRARRRIGDAAWRDMASRSSLVPFAAIVGGRARLQLDGRELLGGAAGLAAYALFIGGLHQQLFGVAPF
jgi:uncharacterized membrane protein